MKLKQYIGDRQFYSRVFTVMLPVLVQNVITNFVSLLDNLMVGQVGTEPMSGVAIVNQLLFVFILCVFGGLSGAGIFTAQYHGSGDEAGVRYTFRAKLWIAGGSVLLFALVFVQKGSALISLFLHEGRDALDLEATLDYGRRYLRVMLLEMVPFALTQVYASTLRETGETLLPMKAGILAVGVNLLLNYILIFGKLGAPALGVTGAAAATVCARCVECAIVAVWSHTHPARCGYLRGVWRSWRIPRGLLRSIGVLGTPLLLNEVLWSAGMTTLNQCYSLRGLEVVSAQNISSTVSNLFFCAFLSMGTTVSILIGQLLGAGETERAVDEDRKLIAFSVVLCALVGVVMALAAPFVPRLYNTTALVKSLATRFLLVSSAMMPFSAFTNTCYFTLRSGGKVLITFLFDSAFVWCVCIPLAFCLTRLTALPIVPVFLAVQSTEVIKCVSGYFLVKSRRWVNNLVADKPEA